MKMQWLLAVTALTGFFGCADAPAPAPAAKQAASQAVPAWVNAPDAPGVIRAVGVARPNFQGAHMQRETAMADARDKLAHKLAVVISAEYASKLDADTKHIDTQLQKKITEVAKLLLSQSRQVDGFIDRRHRLYVLVEAPDPLASASVPSAPPPPPRLEPFDYETMKNSHCYRYAPKAAVQTKYGLYLGRPIWFFRPDYAGHVGSVGVAEAQEGDTFARRKAAAVSLARADLARRRKIRLDSSHELLRIMKHDVMGGTFEKSLRSRSAAKVMHTKLEDIWLDPKSCEVYAWVVEK